MKVWPIDPLKSGRLNREIYD